MIYRQQKTEDKAPRCTDVVLSSFPIQMLLASGGSPTAQDMVEFGGTKAIGGPSKVGYVVVQCLKFTQ